MTEQVAAEHAAQAAGELPLLDFRAALDVILSILDEFSGEEGRTLALLAMERAKINAA